jgi:hypothetical protein
VGPAPTRHELVRIGVDPPPGLTSIYRALVRNGLIQPKARRRRKVDYRRWERARSVRRLFAALLRRLAANLVASEPLADLYAHSLWALLERRGRPLEADPQFARSLAGGVEALLAEGDLSVQSRRELEQVHYGVRLLTKS